jgi:hypothetical protein
LDLWRFLNPKPGFFLPTTMRPTIPANSIQWDFYTSEDVMEETCWLSVLVMSWLLCSFLTCVLLLIFACLVLLVDGFPSLPFFLLHNDFRLSS